MKNIYIILSQTGTLFSKALHWYTQDPYNHASISFDPSLELMYSFGRKKPRNVFNNGFVEESFNRGLFPLFPDARCCILEIPVTDKEYNIMRNTVERFCHNHKKYRYNLMGVMGNVVGAKLSRKDHYFCSQFVSYILNKTIFWDLNPVTTKPMDFFKIPNKKILFEGKVSEFKKDSLCRESIVI
jgi:hypothetical protein